MTVEAGKRLRMGWVVLLLGVLCAAFGAQAYAQSAIESAGLEFDREQPVALVADQIDYDSTTGVVTASGNVEVFYGERTLTAEQIVYDHNTGRISATGEITLRDPSGTTVFANAAELDADLTNGLVEGARAVMGENIRLSAVEARRIDQRYNSLSKVVYSACKVCADDPTPLWRIRAERVIHDETERVIHYENATLDVLGIPIAWLPYFRHPDPTIDRASGLLVPTPLHDTNFGYGIQLPYYFVIDEQSDATITPFFTTNDGLILQGEYRRLFESGAMRLAGSAAHNDFDGEGRFRGHIDSEGRFDLAYGAEWGFDINITSDDGYLRRYDISPVDTLTSELFVERYRQDSFFDAGALYFQSLRDDEPAGQVPRVFPSLDARYDMNEPYLGGTLGFFTSANVLSRNNGQDTARLSLGADWERSVTLPIGLGLRGFAEVRGDLFGIQEDNAVEDQTSLRLSPHVGVEARYPLVWDVQDGTAHIVEPIVQAIMAPYGGNDADIPIEDSINVEFDETNVIDENHFSGLDNFEEGPRINLALRYEYLNDLGLRLDASAGRVYRFRDVTAFLRGFRSLGSGLGLRRCVVGGLRSLRVRPSPDAALAMI